MVKVKIFRKSRKGNTGNTDGGIRVAGGGTSSDYSSQSGHAAEADHASTAARLDADSPDWQTIDSKDAAALAEAKAYSDTQDKAQDEANEKKFLHKDIPDTASGLITFLKGLTSDELAAFLKGISVGAGGKWGISEEGVATLKKAILSDGFQTANYTGDTLTGTGAMVDGDGRGVLDTLFVRQFISAPKFVFNEINVTAAEQWNTNGHGTIESCMPKESTAGSASTSGVITLHLQENEYGSLAVGDLCRGIYADFSAQAATVDSQDACGFATHKGFFTSYFRVDSIIENEKGKFTFRYSKPSKSKYTTLPAAISQCHDPVAFMDFAQYGNDTDTSRQASMYMSSRGHNFIDSLEGVDDWVIQPEMHVSRYGWLGGITVKYKSDELVTLPKGNGIFAQDNVYFGSAVIRLDNISNLEDLQRRAGAYDVTLSRYQGVVNVDAAGRIQGGLYTVSADGKKQWKLSTAVYVRKGMDVLTEQDGSDAVTDGHYRLTAASDDCDVEVNNSTVYITHIKNLLDGVDDTEALADDAAQKAMLATEHCKVTLTIDLEGRAAKTVEFPVRVVHDGQKGDPGSTGKDGCILRPSEWHEGVEYHNDASLSGTPRYLDVALISKEGSTDDYYAWECLKTHTATAYNKPGTDGGKAYWKQWSSPGPIYTPIVIAHKALVDFLQAGNILLQGNVQNIVREVEHGTCQVIDPEAAGFWRFKTEAYEGSEAFGKYDRAINESIAVLPMYDAFTGSVVKTAAYRKPGVRICIQNAYCANAENWDIMDKLMAVQYNAGQTEVCEQALAGIHRAALVLCADPRVLDTSNYSATGTTAFNVSIQSAQDTAGLFVCNGRVGKFLILMPGETVELQSYITTRVEKDAEGNDTSVSTLYWQVIGGAEYRAIGKRLTVDYDGLDKMEGMFTYYNNTSSGNFWGEAGKLYLFANPAIDAKAGDEMSGTSTTRALSSQHHPTIVLNVSDTAVTMGVARSNGNNEV